MYCDACGDELRHPNQRHDCRPGRRARLFELRGDEEPFTGNTEFWRDKHEDNRGIRQADQRTES